MTYEDVKNIRKSPTHSIVDGGSDYKELSIMIDDAIEKQIPKKAIEICEFSDNDLVGLCPLCNEGVNNGMTYCSNCGQAIDWSN